MNNKPTLESLARSLVPLVPEPPPNVYGAGGRGVEAMRLAVEVTKNPEALASYDPDSVYAYAKPKFVKLQCCSILGNFKGKNRNE